MTYIHTYIQPYIDAYIHTYVHTWVTCVCLLMLYLRMNFRFACSDALIGTKSGIFTKLMDASLEVHVLLRRKHRIWFIRPQIYWHASHPIYTNRNIQVHWGHGVERFGEGPSSHLFTPSRVCAFRLEYSFLCIFVWKRSSEPITHQIDDRHPDMCIWIPSGG